MIEAPPNPLALDPLPSNWPTHGTLHGRSVDLAEAKRTLSPSVLCDIEVDVPGEGVIRPWRGSDYAIGPGGEILL
jgi:hypothetical protein